MTIYEAWGEGCGGGVACCCSGLWHRSLGSLLVGPCLQELHALAWVVLPMQHCLVVNKFAALPIDYFLSEVLILQQVQEVKAHGVSEKRKLTLDTIFGWTIKKMNTELVSDKQRKKIYEVTETGWWQNLYLVLTIYNRKNNTRNRIIIYPPKTM